MPELRPLACFLLFSACACIDPAVLARVQAITAMIGGLVDPDAR
jgi:hypothetical protein